MTEVGDLCYVMYMQSHELCGDTSTDVYGEQYSHLAAKDQELCCKTLMIDEHLSKTGEFTRYACSFKTMSPVEITDSALHSRCCSPGILC